MLTGLSVKIRREGRFLFLISLGTGCVFKENGHDSIILYRKVKELTPRGNGVGPVIGSYVVLEIFLDFPFILLKNFCFVSYNNDEGPSQPATLSESRE